MKLPSYRNTYYGMLMSQILPDVTRCGLLVLFLVLVLPQTVVGQSAYTSKSVLLEDRERSVQARVSVHIRALVNPGHVVEIVKGTIPLWRNNTGVLSVNFDCSPQNLGNYFITVKSISNSGAFQEKSIPSGNWCGGREQFDIVKTGRHELSLTIVFNEGNRELDSKTLTFDLNVIGFDEDNGLVRIKQLTGENTSVSAREKLVSLVEFIEAYEKYPEGGTRSRRIKQDLGDLYQRIDWLEDQLSTQIDPLNIDQVTAYYRTIVTSSVPLLKRFHPKAERFVDQLDDLRWKQSLNEENFEAIEAYAQDFCPQWEAAGFSCSHVKEIDAQLDLLLGNKIRGGERLNDPNYWCLLLAQLENSDYYNTVKYQSKFRKIEDNCAAGSRQPVSPGQPATRSDPCEGLCKRARSATKVRTQYELWSRVKNECRGAPCYNEALKALEKLQFEIACLDSWNQLNDLVSQVVDAPNKRQEVVEVAEQLGRDCPKLLPQTEQILADFDQVRIAEQVKVGDNRIKITFEAGKGIYLDPQSATTGTLTYTEAPLEGWAVKDKEFYVRVWDNSSHTLIFWDKWGNTIETEISKLSFVWQDFQQVGDSLRFTLSGGREPFVVEFYTSSESVGKRPVYEHSLGESRTLSLAKSSLPPDIDGMYYLQVKDRFKRPGMTSEAESAENRIETLQIDRPWQAQAWMFLLPVLLMVSGFIFYRNSSYGRPY
ncbi:MAG: hypothetical protein AAGA10_02305 [Bacteroidota bacterium]